MYFVLQECGSEAKRMDHIVLVVSDLQAAIEFYRDILDMRAEQRGANTALLFGDCKIHLHEMQTGARPVAAVPAWQPRFLRPGGRQHSRNI